MSGETQAIVANGIPLAIVAALYTAVTAALAPTALRERHRMSTLVFAFLSLFPILAVLIAVLAGYVFVEAKPLGDHLWIGLAAIVVAALAPLAVLVQIGRGKRFLNRWASSSTASSTRSPTSRAGSDERATPTPSPLAILEQAVALEAVPLAAVVVLDEAGAPSRGPVPSRRRRARQLEISRSTGVPGAPCGSRRPRAGPRRGRRLHPMPAGRRVAGVLYLVTVRELTPDELALLQALAAEGGSRSTAPLRHGAGRGARAGAHRRADRRKVRSELDLDAVLEVAVSETGRALDVSRCFIRLGVTGEQMTDRRGVGRRGRCAPSATFAERLPVTNLATRRRETVAIADVLAASELEDAEAGGREVLRRGSARAPCSRRRSSSSTR